ncbi:GNAT family N-acetyltransferase (plasmid) [Shinella sp. H4-D48]|uniref:GNAT family N-acetyltransferase n=1 Tax=Shinella sp. H4-D48 TaxID=2925841 RepID=UPI001F531BE2|nr:GNAT family N-acetyltransferase [Shinella sp. H4-D48]UNK39976.1 GNAT family N-acetyltransferase [Shinella sp. H4-D48]
MLPVIVPVQADAMASVAHLTFPTFVGAFSKEAWADAPAVPLRVVAYRRGTPVGLALALHRKDYGQGELLSLAVDRAFRRQGIGVAILREVEGHLRAAHIAQISARFSDRLPESSAFGATVASAGWNGPVPERIRIMGRVGNTLEVFRDREKLLKRALRDGLMLVPWRNFPHDAKSHILRTIAEGRAPGWSSAGLFSDNFDPDFSMVLTTGADTIVGWVICHFHAGVRRWSFPVGWIAKEYQRRGWLLVAYAEGARRLGEQFGSDSIAVLESTMGLPMMWRVLEDRFAPYAQVADRILSVDKKL